MKVLRYSLLLSIFVACQQLPFMKKSPEASSPASTGPIAEARSLLDQGQLDAALAKLLTIPDDPDSLYYQGLVWTKKAELAPLPAPQPPSPGSDAPPRTPEFKAEELRALSLFDRAIGMQPDLAGAYIAQADLLAPHAIRRFELEKAARQAVARSRRGRRAPSLSLPAPDPSAPDYRPERVVSLYQEAARLDPASVTAVKSILRFATRVQRSVDIEWCLKELVNRDRENPEPLVRYGDFLLNDKRDTKGAIEQYRQALIWRPDDETINAKIADIYIQIGRTHFDAGQWSLAEARFREAQRFVNRPNSPQDLKLRDYMQRLAAIRDGNSRR
jgi:tetratricopeptide (TPR) repeat protein